jgi:hypothetical protein
MYIKDEYILSFKGEDVGWLHVMSDGRRSYRVSNWLEEEQKEALKSIGLDKDIETKEELPAIKALMAKEHRVKGKKQPIFVDGDWTLTRRPQELDDTFLIYRCGAEKGAPGYSEKNHSAPHWEGPKTPDGMKEWCTWYLFRKMDDGTYEAELDESWWWGGGHNDGGTIRTPIPEEWHSLPYDEFLEKVVGLSSARHYGFDAEDLKEKNGLKEFFGY